MESEDSRKRSREERMERLMVGKICRSRVDILVKIIILEILEICNFGKINFVLKRFEESKDLGKKV